MKSKIFSAIGLVAVASALLLVCSTNPHEPNPAVAAQSVTVPSVPERADFCGEELPLDNMEVYECLDREIITNTFLHSNTIQIIKRTGRYFPLIERILKENGLPDDLKYLCVAESNLIPTAKSPAGAAGLWQFMAPTAKEYGLAVNDDVDERLDVVKSTNAACKFLKSLYRSLGSWSLVAAAYNGGLARVKRNVEAQAQDSYFDIHWAEETKRYLFRIVALKHIISSPETYGFDFSQCGLYKPYEVETVTVRKPIPDLALWAKEHGTTYRMVRLLNPKLLRNRIDYVAGGSMEIAVPAK